MLQNLAVTDPKLVLQYYYSPLKILSYTHHIFPRGAFPLCSRGCKTHDDGIKCTEYKAIYQLLVKCLTVLLLSVSVLAFICSVSVVFS